MPAVLASHEKHLRKKVLPVKKVTKATKAAGATTAKQKWVFKDTKTGPISQSTTGKLPNDHPFTTLTLSLQNCGKPTTQKCRLSVNRYQRHQEMLAIRAKRPQITLRVQ
jgi:hypothetical protein